MKRYLTNGGLLFCLYLVTGQPAMGQVKAWLDLQNLLKFSPSVPLEDTFHSDLQYFPPQIRVKIFPHRYTYFPHGRDWNTKSFSILSDGACLIYEGKRQEPGRLDVLLSSSSVLNLDANNLPTPLWIECPQQFKLQRSAALPSYTYTGALYVKVQYDFTTKRRQLLAVNILPIELYLRGVVPSEVSTEWHLETLKTQAVAARTYAVFHRAYARKYSRHPDFDVDDSIIFQVYTGISHAHPASDLAIVGTTGQILMHGRQIIQAYYHADSGGHTSSAADMFNLHAPYCLGRKELPVVTYNSKRWRRVVTVDELNERLLPALNLPLRNPIQKVSVIDKNRVPGGRVLDLDVRLRNGFHVRLPMARFKKYFALDSTLFSVLSVDEGRAFAFEGMGNGHGVGLNQIGAKVLADKLAWKYEQILKYYYAQTKICSIERNFMDTATPSCFGNGQWAGSEPSPKAATSEKPIL